MTIKEQFEQMKAEIDKLRVEARTILIRADVIEQALDQTVKKLEQEEWPKDGDRYYYLYGNGILGFCVWSGDKSNKDSMSIGNAFRTREEAEFAVERLKVLAEMKKFAFEPDWCNGMQKKYGIFYRYGKSAGNGVQYAEWWYAHGTPVFESEEFAEKCISAIGEERLKKYYFGVKDDG